MESPWKEAPIVNALFHVAVRLFMLALAYVLTYARNPGGLKKMFLMYVCSFFLASIYIFNLYYLPTNQAIRKYELCKIYELEPVSGEG